MSIKDKLAIMFRMQDEANKLTYGAGENWKEKDLPFWRAARDEIIEAQGHFGWEWWKPKEPNWPQIKLEIVDAFHFLISDKLADSDDAYLIDRLYEKFHCPNVFGKSSFMERCDYFVHSSSNFQFVSTTCFIGVFKSSGMTFDELFNLYVAKNTLNRFRQANGYAEGKYIKIWNGREDNEVLYDIAMSLGDIEDPQKVTDVIFDKLTAEYSLL